MIKLAHSLALLYAQVTSRPYTPLVKELEGVPGGVARLRAALAATTPAKGGAFVEIEEDSLVEAVAWYWATRSPVAARGGTLIAVENDPRHLPAAIVARVAQRLGCSWRAA